MISYGAQKALVVLCKRNNSKSTYWYTFVFNHYTEKPYIYTCLICDFSTKHYAKLSGILAMEEHGLEHLKQHNLLAFI